MLTAETKCSLQSQNSHGKTKMLTAKPKCSRQNQNAHGKTKMLTSKPKCSRQNQTAHRKTKKLTAKPKAHGKTKQLTAKPNSSRQNQKTHGIIISYSERLRKFVFNIIVIILQHKYKDWWGRGRVRTLRGKGVWLIANTCKYITLCNH